MANDTLRTLYDILQVTFRFIISAAIVFLIFKNQINGGVGGLYVTVILGVDLAALFEAYKETRQPTQTKFDQ